MKVFRIERSDLGQMAMLVNRAYRGESSRVGWTTEADYLDGQRTSEELLVQSLDEGKIFLGIKDDQSLLGCVAIETFQEANRQGAYMGMLTIEPTKQNSGLGKVLLTHCETLARGFGCSFLRLHVIQLREPLIAWYVKLGYQDTGRRQPFPYGREEFGVPRRDDLHFVVLEKNL